MNNYVSSIMSHYGDIERVKTDAETLSEILSRQGSRLLIEVLAENTGKSASKFKLNDRDRERLTESLIRDLKESLNERV